MRESCTITHCHSFAMAFIHILMFQKIERMNYIKMYLISEQRTKTATTVVLSTLSNTLALSLSIFDRK